MIYIQANIQKYSIEHIATLSSLHDLAINYSYQSLYDIAEPLFIQCLEGRRRVLGVYDPATLGVMNDLGR